MRRTTSRFGARLEPFGHVDVQLAGEPQPRRRHTIRQVEGIEPVRQATWLATIRATPRPARSPETAERLTPIEQEPSLRLFQLTLGALRALADRRARRHAWCSTPTCCGRWRTAGWAPALTECAVCGSAGPHAAFSVPAGGVVCPDCRPPGAAHPAPATLELHDRAAGRRLGQSPTRSEAPIRRECSGLVAAHLQWHLERGLRSLPLVDRSTSDGESSMTVGSTIRPPTPHPSGARPPPLPGAGAAAARRDRHGRQRPLGQGARAAPHRGPRAGRVLALRHHRGRASSWASRTCRRTPSPPRTGSARRTRSAS